LSAFIDQVEAGASINVIQHEKVVARLAPILLPRLVDDASIRQALTLMRPVQSERIGDFLGTMQDWACYQAARRCVAVFASLPKCSYHRFVT
jgi:antitoxin (DNA-binding transcriptional repressor) of toxin-antitoxin stability system